MMELSLMTNFPVMKIRSAFMCLSFAFELGKSRLASSFTL